MLKNFFAIFFKQRNKVGETTFVFSFENFFSFTTKHDNVFFANGKICDFLQMITLVSEQNFLFPTEIRKDSGLFF